MRVLWVLALALSGRGAGAFVVQVSSSCALAPNGSALAFGLTFLFNKNPLVCYDPDNGRFVPCDWGLLHGYAAFVALVLNDNASWLQRAEQRRRACQELAHEFWGATALRQTPPQARVVPSSVPGAPDVVLSCHVWGFYPPAVTVEWLHDGAVVAAGDTAAIRPRGDLTYQTQVPLRLPRGAGGAFTCAVRHAGLERALRRRWGPGLSPELTEKVAVAAVTVTLGLLIFGAGTFCYCRQGTAAAGGGLAGDTDDVPKEAAASASCPGNR
ncbi:class II histocompatibility antigen, M beta 1 chain-like [Patagioenas fasciata]|uniref:class II histocompatibility antigen, M beta 1 chain-like n=1 Tax=Patagioenas fasciata TaxID=372321 RepID=UPI003A993EBC